MKEVITFFNRRPWLRDGSVSQLWGKYVPSTVLSKEDFQTLKENGTLGRRRDDYLKAFMHGWLAAKK